MKYVLFETPYPDCMHCMPVVRIFEEITNHSEVRVEVLFHKPGLKVVSAGKIWFNAEGGCTCVHKSTSIGMSFDEEKGEEASKTISQIMQRTV